MAIVAIDPGTIRLGVAILGEDWNMERAAQFRLSPRVPTDMRIGYLVDAVCSYLAMSNPWPADILIEEPTGYRRDQPIRRRTLIALARLVGGLETMITTRFSRRILLVSSEQWVLDRSGRAEPKAHRLERMAGSYLSAWSVEPEEAMSSPWLRRHEDMLTAMALAHWWHGTVADLGRDKALEHIGFRPTPQQRSMVRRTDYTFR